MCLAETVVNPVGTSYIYLAAPLTTSYTPKGEVEYKIQRHFISEAVREKKEDAPVREYKVPFISSND